MISAENEANIYSLKKYIEISKEIKIKDLINNWLSKKIIEKGYRVLVMVLVLQEQF